MTAEKERVTPARRSRRVWLVLPLLLAAALVYARWRGHFPYNGTYERGAGGDAPVRALTFSFGGGCRADAVRGPKGAPLQDIPCQYHMAAGSAIVEFVVQQQERSGGEGHDRHWYKLRVTPAPDGRTLQVMGLDGAVFQVARRKITRKELLPVAGTTAVLERR